ncbi:MAG: helix-turn-helix domain-containing protein [Bacilli bacterium]|nr:helix-turn-helix domain-containing protein [Bacilli bacterium]
MNDRPSFNIIIPAEIRLDENLKDKAKLLFGVILTLSIKTGYCFASNKYLAKELNVSTTTISILIKELIDRGYVTSEFIYREGTKEILNRYLRIVKEGYLSMLKDPLKGKLKDNITSNNITSNYIKEEILKEENIDLFDYDWINDMED